MNEQDRQAIEDLFSRLADAERQAGPKDADADAYIKRQIERQPGAPYMMAQTIVVQTYALEQAQQRIRELEEQAEERPSAANGGNGVFGGLFGGGGRSATSVPRSGSVPAAGSPMGSPAAPMQQPQPQGGGFLAGAAQTAMGVAGGVLLGNAIGSMFGGGAAQAAPATASQTPPEPQAQPAAAEPAAEPQPASDEGGGGWLDSLFGGGDDTEL